MVIAQFDGHLSQGYPTFAGWPRFTSRTHQQHHVDWIRRAYDGGLRLMVALGVNNMFWATRALNPGVAPGVAVDDESSVLAQIAEIKRVAQQHSDWMRIVTSPADAREAILDNKLAIVLGVEMDNFGNFKDADSPWRDVLPNSRPHVALPAEPAAAQPQIRRKVAEYRALGVRQVTPLHYVSGPFGGTAVFRFEFSMVNGSMTGRPYQLMEGWGSGYYYNPFKDADPIKFYGGYLEEFIRTRGMMPLRCVERCDIGPINSEGLSARGEVLIDELMRAGILIDAEHASARAVDGIFARATSLQYPVLSSHTNPLELAFSAREAKRIAWPDTIEDQLSYFDTTVIGNLPHEGMTSEATLSRIAGSGGTVGVLAYPFRVKDFQGRVLNNNAGSSKSWAQMYQYASARMSGRGVALSTDRGFNDSVGPRFGVWSAYSLKQEKGDAMKAQRTLQRYAQHLQPGVKYDRHLQDWNPARFEFGDVGDEEDLWKALAWWEAVAISPWSQEYDALPASRKVPNSSFADHPSRILNLVWGLAASTMQQLDGAAATADAGWERLAMYLLKSRLRPNAVADRLNQTERQSLERIYYWAKPVYDLWLAREGNNAPLRKRVDGVRDWDFNIDGLAHYGMLPDMLQDLRNVGLTASDLTPLFRSAEDYIRMWEKADQASRRFGG